MTLVGLFVDFNQFVSRKVLLNTHWLFHPAIAGQHSIYPIFRSFMPAFLPTFLAIFSCPKQPHYQSIVLL
jgi:hypothetical protein